MSKKLEDIAIYRYQQIRFYRCMSGIDLAFLHRLRLRNKPSSLTPYYLYLIPVPLTSYTLPLVPIYLVNVLSS